MGVRYDYFSAADDDAARSACAGGIIEDEGFGTMCLACPEHLDTAKAALALGHSGDPNP